MRIAVVLCYKKSNRIGSIYDNVNLAVEAMTGRDTLSLHKIGYPCNIQRNTLIGSRLDRWKAPKHRLMELPAGKVSAHLKYGQWQLMLGSKFAKLGDFTPQFQGLIYAKLCDFHSENSIKSTPTFIDNSFEVNDIKWFALKTKQDIYCVYCNGHNRYITRNEFPVEIDDVPADYHTHIGKAADEAFHTFVARDRLQQAAS